MGSGHVLRYPEVRPAVHPDVAVAPGLRREPLNDLVRIACLRLREQPLESAEGRAASAHADGCYDVAVADKASQVRLGIDRRADIGDLFASRKMLHQFSGVAMVARVSPHDGQGLLHGHPIDRGPGDVDRQLHPVAHLDVLRIRHPLIEAGLGKAFIAAEL